MNRCMLLSIVLYAHALGITGDVIDEVMGADDGGHRLKFDRPIPASWGANWEGR